MLEYCPAQNPLPFQSLGTEKALCCVSLYQGRFGILQNPKPIRQNPGGRHLTFGKSKYTRLEEGVPLGRSVVDILTAKQKDVLPV
jgi:hypothetical protein